MHLPNLIVDLTLILASAAVMGLVFKALKQPLVLGYIIAGILVGPYFKFFPTVTEQENIRIWADIGVIFLLFNLGLEFSFKKIMKEGMRLLLIALPGVGLTLFTGFLLGNLLGWGLMDALFMGGMLSIASTTIIIRAFEELGVKTQKFADTVTSILVIEDLVAVILMVVLSAISISKEFQGKELFFSVARLIAFLILWFVSGIYFLPSVLRQVRKILSEELLLILALALCFVFVWLALKAGFSPAFGAFIMGSVLAETKRAEKVEYLITPLKYLFGAIFFVSVGMLLDPAMIVVHFVPVCGAVLVLLVGKPLFVMLGSLLSGQSLKASVQTGMSLSQIGEFSFIMASLGLSLNVTSDFLYPVAVVVSVITTFTTPYMIRFSETVSGQLELRLPARWLIRLNAYSSSVGRIGESTEWNLLLRATLVNVMIYAAIVISVILLMLNFAGPYFDAYGWSRILLAILTIMISLPFLWALAFRRVNKALYASVYLNKAYRLPLLVLQVSRLIISIVLIGFLFDRLFSPFVALEGGVITTGVLILFAKRIQRFYGKIEARFLSNFNERDSGKGAVTNTLAPWDAHLSVFIIPSQSVLLGKTIGECGIREQFGLNIAAIERGDRIISVPGRDERIYPNDKLSVIGSDQQMQAFTAFLSQNKNIPDVYGGKQEIRLLSFVVHADSVLLAKSIKESGIREKTHGLVVGIERNGIRMLNPGSEVVFTKDDVVWIVGHEKRIQVIAALKN